MLSIRSIIARGCTFIIETVVNCPQIQEFRGEVIISILDSRRRVSYIIRSHEGPFQLEKEISVQITDKMRVICMALFILLCSDGCATKGPVTSGVHPNLTLHVSNESTRQEGHNARDSYAHQCKSIQLIQSYISDIISRIISLEEYQICQFRISFTVVMSLTQNDNVTISNISLYPSVLC